MNIFGTKFDYESRVERLRKEMDKRDLDCMLVHLWPNQYYVSGFYHHLPWYPLSLDSSTESPLIIFRDPAEPPIFLCGFLVYNAILEGSWLEDVRAFDKESNLGAMEYLAEVLAEKKVASGNIGLEDEICTISTFRKLEKALPKARFHHASDVFNITRSIKEPEEVELIRKAVKIAESAMRVAMDMAKPGVPEMDVQREIEIEMRRQGAVREVETMCQSGIRTANYRAFAAEWKKIGENELVMVDLGAIYKGYSSDITRTWPVGEATDEQKKIASDLYKVHAMMMDFIKPGVIHRDVAQFAIDEMEAMGYGSNCHTFPHWRFSFHGLGLGPFHDPPDNHHPDTVLEAGMVVSIQPGARHEKYTIRFEDDILVTPDGAETLMTIPIDLI
ncbi:MAG: aminopeptidase P family protein [Nitrospinaceae bacterium]|jgi:Xaa-Pro aminopeptidase|nr:aminopeptidase P family protein [Nitrospinaceae bacterium]MBT3819801.1 aminopeptidase P family protein [Nitrospinaceae bacterium]MBT4431958.1 aminopeptidase P family protein [Nitrospinaceae bacterium]MBT5948765.1 aminopeptidase P family protein [Nitrospinaceae bacterium]MBT6394377.1 aminopeptidase P family protein [Nitrospinaceae bacterium]